VSFTRLRQLVTQVAVDEVINLQDVQVLIAEAASDRLVSPGEQLVLSAALEAHRGRFTEEAYRALKAFLGAVQKAR
jgi:hypothetical protein